MFTKYDTTEEVVEPRVLTDDEKKQITDDFAEGKTVTEIKHTRFFPTSLIKQSISHKLQTEKNVIALMRGEILISEAEVTIDEETGETTIETPAVYNVIPTTITALKSAAAELEPDCVILNYNIDKIIESASTEGTFTKFKALFSNG